MNLQNVAMLKNMLVQKLNESDKEILSKFPVNEYISHIKKYPKIRDYKYISPEISNMCSHIIHLSNEQTLETYHKLILLELILDAKEKVKRKNFPDDVKNLYYINFKRIIKQIESKNEPGFYLYTNGKFLKDFGICNLHIIPAGAQKINLKALPYRLLFNRLLFKKLLSKEGVNQFIKGILLVFFELKGLKPLLELHTDSHDPDLMADFNPEGWKRFYKRTAEILKKNKEIKGIFGSSWLLDPQLEKISPRLVYIREIAEKNGAKLFCSGTNSHVIKDAIFKSKTRRRLYNEKKYFPTGYTMVWPRKKIIEWAKRY